MRRLPFITLVLLFALPFVYFGVAAFAEQWRFPALWPPGWTLQHWAALGGGQWGQSALLSLSLALLTGGIATALGFWTAHGLSQSKHARRWLLWAYFPYAFSPVIYAHGLKFFFNSAQLAGQFLGVLLGQLILCYPFAVLFFFSHFDQRLREMEALSYTLGAGPRAVWWRVLLPVSRPALLLCFFQIFLISWFDYGLSSVIGLGQVRTLTVAVYQYILEANAGWAAVSACLLCLPPLVLLWINQGFLQKVHATNQ